MRVRATLAAAVLIAVLVDFLPAFPGAIPLFGGLPIPGAPTAVASEEIPKGIAWVNDWDKALATAAERGVPVLVSFASDDWSRCRRLDAAVYADEEGRKVVAEFVPIFAHEKLVSDAYGKAMTRYFKAGIQVPLIIFADPTGREIPGTRLEHPQAQVKAQYLANARKALELFRAGLTPEKSKEAWSGLGRALRLRLEGKDPGAGVEEMVALRDAAVPKSPLRTALDEMLERIDKEEAAGLVDVGRMDLEGDDPPAGIETLFGVLRDFPGLPSAAKAKSCLDGAAAAPATKEIWTAQDREYRAHVALRAADRLQRAGKEKEAKEAWAKVAKEFEGTAAAAAAKSRK